MKARFVFEFDPPWWSIVVNPHFLPRRALIRAMRETAPLLQGRLLDLGCGRQPYKALLTSARDIVGLELDSPRSRAEFPNADFFYDGRHMPFPDAHFDSVLCNQVLEHVFEPDKFLSEIRRVLRPGGLLLLSMPFLWPEHEQPNDSQRFTRYGLTYRLNRHAFSVHRHDRLLPGIAALLCLLADELNTRLRPLPTPFRIMARAMLVAPASMLGWLMASLPSSRETSDAALYLDHFVLAERGAEAEAPNP